jgi:hypothetical protein
MQAVMRDCPKAKRNEVEIGTTQRIHSVRNGLKRVDVQTAVGFVENRVFR